MMDSQDEGTYDTADFLQNNCCRSGRSFHLTAASNCEAPQDVSNWEILTNDKVDNGLIIDHQS